MSDESIENFKNMLEQQSSRYKEESKNIQAISFASYITPVFKENKYKNFITAGPDNLWPQYLVRLAESCPIHKAILEDKVKQVIGEGFAIDDSEDKDQVSQMTEFLKKINIKKQLKRWAKDQQYFGYFFIGITWNKTRTAIANIYHVDATTIRVGEPNEDGIIDYFWYSEDWTRYKKTNFRPKKVQRFDPLNRIDENCLVMIKNYNPNTRFYTLPEYNACRDAIELSAALTSYMLNSILNGLTPSLNISFNNGIPTEEERETVYRTINGLFKGDKNAGRYILSFNQSKQNSTEITPINVGNMSEQYAQLGSYAEDQIIRGHGTYPILVGKTEPGKLGGAGNSSELEVTSEDFFNKVIEPAQDSIEEIMQDLLEINGWEIRVFIKPLKKISSALSDTLLMNTMTVDEIRRKINLSPLSESDKANLAINITNPPAPSETSPTPGTTAPATQSEMQNESPVAPVNDNIKNLNAKQHQQLIRIIRQYGKGQLTKETASVLLQTGLGLSEDDINKMLPDTEDDSEETMAIATPGLKPYVNELPTKKKKD